LLAGKEEKTPKEVVVQQAEIRAGEHSFTVTHIPTATSGSWFVIHHACEIWAAVAIEDCTSEVIGCRNPPKKFQKEIEEAIKKEWGIPV